MAEYCAQCAIEHNMQNGMAGLCKSGQLALEVCEGCGVIQVNHRGECVSNDCGKLSHAVEVVVRKQWWKFWQ